LNLDVTVKAFKLHCKNTVTLVFPETRRKEVKQPFGTSGLFDGWVINKTAIRMILLKIKRASDTSDNYFEGIKRTADSQHTPIWWVSSQIPGEGWRLGGGRSFLSCRATVGEDKE